MPTHHDDAKLRQEMAAITARAREAGVKPLAMVRRMSTQANLDAAQSQKLASIYHQYEGRGDAGEKATSITPRHAAVAHRFRPAEPHEGQTGRTVFGRYEQGPERLKMDFPAPGKKRRAPASRESRKTGWDPSLPDEKGTSLLARSVRHVLRTPGQRDAAIEKRYGDPKQGFVSWLKRGLRTAGKGAVQYAVKEFQEGPRLGPFGPTLKDIGRMAKGATRWERSQLQKEDAPAPLKTFPGHTARRGTGKLADILPKGIPARKSTPLGDWAGKQREREKKIQAAEGVPETLGGRAGRMLGEFAPFVVTSALARKPLVQVGVRGLPLMALEGAAGGYVLEAFEAAAAGKSRAEIKKLATKAGMEDAALFALFGIAGKTINYLRTAPRFTNWAARTLGKTNAEQSAIKKFFSTLIRGQAVKVLSKSREGRPGGGPAVRGITNVGELTLLLRRGLGLAKPAQGWTRMAGLPGGKTVRNIRGKVLQVTGKGFKGFGGRFRPPKDFPAQGVGGDVAHGGGQLKPPSFYRTKPPKARTARETDIAFEGADIPHTLRQPIGRTLPKPKPSFDFPTGGGGQLKPPSFSGAKPTPGRLYRNAVTKAGQYKLPLNDLSALAAMPAISETASFMKTSDGESRTPETGAMMTLAALAFMVSKGKMKLTPTMITALRNALGRNWSSILERAILAEGGKLNSITPRNVARAFMSDVERTAAKAELLIDPKTGARYLGKELVRRKKSAKLWADPRKYLKQTLDVPEHRSLEEMQAAARAGRVKLGWYASASKALAYLFSGKTFEKQSDIQRFTNLVSALSPQQSVIENLRMAFRAWADWVLAGRPQDKQKLIAVFEREAGVRAYNAAMADGKTTISVPAYIHDKLVTVIDPKTKAVQSETYLGQLEKILEMPGLVQGKARKGLKFTDVEQAAKFKERMAQASGGGVLFGGRKGNVLASLMSKEQSFRLSGPKVSPFAEALMGAHKDFAGREAIVKDVWMAIFWGDKNLQGLFATAEHAAAFNAYTIKAARNLGMSPAETQETVWAFTKFVSAMKRGGYDDKRIIDTMTHRSMAQIPDFGGLLGDPAIQKVLNTIGTEFKSLPKGKGKEWSYGAKFKPGELAGRARHASATYGLRRGRQVPIVDANDREILLALTEKIPAAGSPESWEPAAKAAMMPWKESAAAMAVPGLAAKDEEGKRPAILGGIALGALSVTPAGRRLVPRLLSGARAALTAAGKDYTLTGAAKQTADLIRRGAPGKVRKPAAETVDELTRNFFNPQHPIFKREAAAASKGHNVPPSISPMYQTFKARGREVVAGARIQFEYLPILERIPKGMDETVEVILAAERNIELGKRGITGLKQTPAESAEALEIAWGIVRKAGKENTVRGVIRDFRGYTRDMLDYYAETGMISREAVAAAKRDNRVYAPFYRVFDEAEKAGLNPIFEGSGSALEVRGQTAIKKIRGSERAIRSPFESMFHQTHKMHDLGERNLVARRYLDFAEGVPELAGELRKLTGEEVLASGLKDFLPTGEGVLRVFRDGRRELYAVPADLKYAFDHLKRREFNMLENVMRRFAQMLRLGATAFSPGFVAGNPFRDPQSALLVGRTGLRRTTLIPIYDQLKAVAGMVKGDESLKRFMESGAGMSGFIETGRVGHVTLKEMRMPKWRKVVRMANPIRLLDELGSKGETSTRKAIFENMYKDRLKMGWSKKDATAWAMREARTATLDFNQIGASMERWNAIVPFMNPAAQGLGRQYLAWKEAPMRTALRLATFFTVPAIATYYWNDKVMGEDFHRQPSFVKNMYWQFATPWKNFQFPVAPDIRPYVGAVWAFLDHLRGDDREAWERLKDAANDFGPPFIPQFVLPVVEQTAGVRLFGRRKIVPPGLEDAPLSMQKRARTSQTAVALAAAARKVPVIGKLPVLGSPARLEALGEQVFGTAAREAMTVADVAGQKLGVFEKRKLPPHRVPVKGRFIFEAEAEAGGVREWSMGPQMMELVKRYRAGDTERVTRYLSAMPDHAFYRLMSAFGGDSQAPRMARSYKSFATREINEVNFVLAGQGQRELIISRDDVARMIDMAVGAADTETLEYWRRKIDRGRRERAQIGLGTTAAKAARLERQLPHVGR